MNEEKTCKTVVSTLYGTMKADERKNTEYIYRVESIGEGDYIHTLVGELVRCEECKWYRYEECSLMRGLVVACDNDYCSYGERKTDNARTDI